MAYYSVAAVRDRRINDEDGSIEYAVKWDGYDDGDVTWERRHQLTENCAEMVQAVDQHCMDSTDAALAKWRRTTWARRSESTTTCSNTTTLTALSPPTRSTTAGVRKRSRSASRSDDNTTSDATDQQTRFESEDGREEEEGEEEDVEVLNGLLLRAPPRLRAKDEENTAANTEEATILMLGEVVLAEEASAALNRGGSGGSCGNGSHRKKRPQTAAKAALTLNTAPAVGVEKLWRAMHGQSLLHSVEVAQRVTPFRDNFQLRLADAETRRLLLKESRRSSHLRILSIAPPRATLSGAVFGAPVALEGLVGEKDVEEMRLSVQLESSLYGTAAQEIAKPHVEQMVVRYTVSQSPSVMTSSSPVHLGPCHVPEYVTSMPLSVFRLAFPQLLIDYLLENSVVLH